METVEVLNQEEAFALLKRKIYRERGLDCDLLKENFVKRRFAVRLRATGSNDYRDYLLVLRRDPEEYQHLLNELTINLTSFFRDPGVYERIRDSVIPSLLDDKRVSGSRMVRVWSAGCASGEESYSIAILFHGHMEREEESWELSVIGTDIDKASLETAKRGIYEMPDLLKDMELTRYFEEAEGDGCYRVKEEIRRPVKFREKDLFHIGHKGFFDLVLCRNVMIYFTREVKDGMLSALARSMRNGGYLVLGKPENLGVARTTDFHPVFLKDRIYQKRLPGR